MSVSAEDVRAIRARVAEQLAELDATGTDDARVRSAELVWAAIDERDAEALRHGRTASSPAASQALHAAVMDALWGLGRLQPLIDDPSIENINVNGHEVAFAERADGTKEAVGPVADSDQELIDLIRSAAARAASGERRFDATSPEVTFRLPDGSRVTALMAVSRVPVVSIRRHRHPDVTLTDLVGLGSISEELAELLRAAVEAELSIVVVGVPGAGKTTLLRALLAAVPPTERIVTAEMTYELDIDLQRDRHPDCVALEARRANIEGHGAIPLGTLVARTLHLNPNRVVVGEILEGGDLVNLLSAMAQGVGGMATLHAKSSAEAFAKMIMLGLTAPEPLGPEATAALVAHAVDLVVHVGMAAEGAGSHRSLARFVTSVREVTGAEGRVVASNEIFRPGRDGHAEPGAPMSPARRERLLAAGYADPLPTGWR